MFQPEEPLKKSDLPFVIRDSREKVDHGWFFKEDAAFAGTKVSKLDTGDYSIVGLEDTLCIERKGCVTEFAQNLVQKRFIKELQRLSDFKYKYLILEFDTEDLLKYPYTSKVPYKVRRTTKMKGSFLFKTMLELQMEYNFHVYFVGASGKSITKSILKRVWEKENGH